MKAVTPAQQAQDPTHHQVKPAVAEQQQPRYNLGAIASDCRFLLPEGGQAVPEEVQKASDQAAAGHERYLQSQRELTAARAAVEQARSIDASADRAAFAQGDSLPKVRALPKAEEAAAAALRAFIAAQDRYTDMQNRLAKVIHRHRTSWLPEQESVVQGHRDAVLDVLSHLMTTYDKLTIEAGILGGLTEFPTQGSLVSVAGFGRVSEFDQALRRKINGADAEESRRKHGAMTAPRDFGSLVGALRRLVVGGARSERSSPGERSSL
jgi:hypothetical protein